jgi:hypothetical protein
MLQRRTNQTDGYETITAARGRPAGSEFLPELRIYWH